MTTTSHTAVAVPLELLKSKTITVLVDSFQAAFMATFDEERDRKQAAKLRLLAELNRVDALGIATSSTAHEEYRPA
ncbi:hypothetical protein [Streptomyces dysideae]|uniref:Uncharacterized protein n=1 Tax=Streptomyces dysideae TaxID=909626 RepID=A0A101UXT9_9ACTN|nr:hypothetical protein [Streptomyces dysideae]KUO18820.1 hypothetical protein AQJ91_23445 [Streptomyces dysideae]